MTTPLRVSAVGDISFEGPVSDRPSVDCFADVIGVFQRSDLTIGNLECALTEHRDGLPGKCTLRGTPRWAPVLSAAGINVVSLANNHVMDFGPEGLSSTLDALRRAGIQAVGAGRNRAEACAPIFIDVAGRRLALLARTSVIVSAPTYATDAQAGVAWMDEEDTARAIRSCRAEADAVILLVHWGLEEYAYPAPAQRAQARQFVDAGAAVVLGHHPHVLQGYEYYNRALIAYSLGNFVFHEFTWSYTEPGHLPSTQLSRLSPENRAGLIVTVHWLDEAAPTLDLEFTTMDQAGRLRIDAGPERLNELRRLSTAISRRWYRPWWQWYALRREWNLRVSERVSWRKLATNLHRIRLRHFRDLLQALRRSGRMVAETTTNPYE